MQRQPIIDLGDDAPQMDMQGLALLGLWGAAAAAALLVVAFATFSEVGQRRLSQLLRSGNAQVQTDAAEEERRRATREFERQTFRLNEQIYELAQDRDRLTARVATLERNYEDATGSIGKLINQSQPAPPEAPPVVAPQTAAVASVRVPSIAESGSPAEADVGMDLGSARNVAAMRAAWERIRRAHGAQLEGLRPLIGVRDGRQGQVELRLVVGPVSGHAEAYRKCAALAAAGMFCQLTGFEGQRLALH